MRIAPVLAALALAAPAAAATDDVPKIVVSGTASAQAAPDRAQLGFSIRGEGATADEAVKALIAKRDAIAGGLGRFREAGPLAAGGVTVSEVRGRECQSYQPQLSVGACSILGYRASIEAEVKTGGVKDAGTMIGLIGRLGGTDPRISRFFLADDAAVRAKALAAAFAEARTRAEGLAAAGHVRLGRLLSATDGSYLAPPIIDSIAVGGSSRLEAPAPPPPPPPPPPIELSVTPKPIDVQARVTLAYEVLP